MGILTGALILACVILTKADSKARTKPLCFRDPARAHLDIFSVLLSLSYGGWGADLNIIIDHYII